MNPTEYSKQEVVEAVRGQRGRTIALLAELKPEEWETIVLPRWRVREVIAHLITMDEGALTGKMLTLGFATGKDGGVSKIEVWNDKQVRRYADRPTPELVEALARWGGRITRFAQFAPSVLAGRPFPTPLGKVSLLWIGMQRVFDEWVHDEDMRRALGRPSDDSPAAVRPVVRQLLAAMPQQTLGRIPESAKGRVALVFPDLSLDPVEVDLEKRRLRVATPGADATVSADGAKLVMAAAGRDAWRDLEVKEALSIDGDRQVAETFLDTLRVV